jgi:uncharacterized protein
MEADKWLTAAATQGDASAQHHLGIMYLEGVGVSKDHLEAYMWFSLASEEEPEAASERDALEMKLSEDELAEAKRRAAAFTPKSWEEVQALNL